MKAIAIGMLSTDIRRLSLLQFQKLELSDPVIDSRPSSLTQAG